MSGYRKVHLPNEALVLAFHYGPHQGRGGAAAFALLDLHGLTG